MAEERQLPTNHRLSWSKFKPFIIGEGWFISLRFLAVLGVLVGLFLTYYPRSEIDKSRVLLTIVLFAVYNLVFWFLAFFQRKRIQVLLTLGFVADILLVFFLVLITGGVSSPFSSLFFLIIPLGTYYFGFWKGLLITTCYITAHIIACLLNPYDHDSILSMLIAQMLTAFFLGFAVAIFAAKDRRERRQMVSLERELAQAEKLSAIGKFASSLAHEIGSPLSVMRGYLDILGEKLENGHPGMSEMIKIKSQFERIIKLIRQLLTFARHSLPQFRPVNVNSIIRMTVDALQQELSKAQVRVVLNPDENLPSIKADPDQLYQVFFNIIMNARHAMQEHGGTLSISSSVKKKALSAQKTGPDFANLIELVVSDTGCGIPANHLNKIFEPFFTTKALGEGSGLGLAICHGIISDHRGRIEVESRPGEGSTFKVFLPITTGLPVKRT